MVLAKWDGRVSVSGGTEHCHAADPDQEGGVRNHHLGRRQETAAPHSPFIRCFNRDEEGDLQQNDSLADGDHLGRRQL